MGLVDAQAVSDMLAFTLDEAVSHAATFYCRAEQKEIRLRAADKSNGCMLGFDILLFLLKKKRFTSFVYDGVQNYTVLKQMMN